MTQTEALRMALEALEEISSHYMSLPKKGCMALAAIEEVLAQPEFIKHEVVSAEDWSEWVCPDPKSYLMKCCDCGLVHEAQFKVVRYKSETEREDCDMVDDPNLQAVFRMRRSEQWTPKDTAYRPGGLAQPEGCQCPACKIAPHASDCAVHNAPAYPIGECDCGTQPEQEPVAWMRHDGKRVTTAEDRKDYPDYKTRYPIPLYTAPPPRQPLSDEEIAKIASTPCAVVGSYVHTFARAIEAAHGIKGEE